jgi:hypothetical protein
MIRVRKFPRAVKARIALLASGRGIVLTPAWTASGDVVWAEPFGGILKSRRTSWTTRADHLAKLQATVLAAVKGKQGQRLEEIGKAIKTDTSELKRPIALLLAEKKPKTTGKKRGIRYFLK